MWYFCSDSAVEQVTQKKKNLVFCLKIYINFRPREFLCKKRYERDILNEHIGAHYTFIFGLFFSSFNRKNKYYIVVCNIFSLLIVYMYEEHWWKNNNYMLLFRIVCVTITWTPGICYDTLKLIIWHFHLCMMDAWWNCKIDAILSNIYVNNYNAKLTAKINRFCINR